MKWLLPAAIAAGLIVIIATRKRRTLSSPTIFDAGPFPSPRNAAPPVASAQGRLARIDAEERALWAQEQTLMDEKDRIARAHEPGWQVRVGAIHTRIVELQGRRGRLNYERSQAQQGRL